MTPSFLFLLIIAALGTAPEPPAPSATLCLRWQQPTVDWSSEATPVGVTARDLHKALEILTRTLQERGVAVHYGYFAAEEPSPDPKAIGRLWINDQPLESLLDPNLTLPGETRTVKPNQIIKAGLLAADRATAAAEVRAAARRAGAGHPAGTAADGLASPTQ